MNKALFMGRITKDIDFRQGDTSVARFPVAIPRRKKDESDFINCVAFGKTAELINQYFGKGNKIALVTHVQTGSYNKQDGTKVYTTDFVVDEWEFCEKRETMNEGFDF